MPKDFLQDFLQPARDREAAETRLVAVTVESALCVYVSMRVRVSLLTVEMRSRASVGACMRVCMTMRVFPASTVRNLV